MPEKQFKRAGFLSFILAKCPRCGKGPVFKNSIISGKFTETHEACSHCKLPYEPETGFFFGAMYMSYAIVIAIIIIGTITMSLLGYFDFAIYAVPVTLILLLPVIFRYSRLLMLFVVYPIMYKNKFYGIKDSEL